jgi:3-oxoacyl-[acyl-carrier-protein] synthase II
MIDPVRACMPGGRFEFELWAKCGLPAIYPLWLLKYLPNMPACHVAIANNAQAPCNSIILNEASGLVALTEGMRLIERGAADLVIVGGVGARLHPTTITFRAEQQLARGADDPASACRPFAIDRSGQVLGEGSGALVLEAAEHALARRATNYGKVAGYAIRHESRRGGRPFQGTALRTALRDCLRAAGCLAEQLSHVNAHGLGTREHDAVEAAAIRDALGQVPVTACKGALGNLGAGCGVVELAASLLAQQAKLVPATRNCSITDPDCAINIVRHEPLPIVLRNFVSLNFAPTGQAVAVCVESG